MNPTPHPPPPGRPAARARLRQRGRHGPRRRRRHGRPAARRHRRARRGQRDPRHRQLAARLPARAARRPRASTGRRSASSTWTSTSASTPSTARASRASCASTSSTTSRARPSSRWPATPTGSRPICREYEASCGAPGRRRGARLRRERPPGLQRPALRRLRRPRLGEARALDEVSRKQQHGEGHFDTLDEVPTHAITLTVPALLAAKRVLCIVPEARKADAVRACLHRAVSEDRPGFGAAHGRARDALPRPRLRREGLTRGRAPNVVVVMADQMKATASHLYGNRFCTTPGARAPRRGAAPASTLAITPQPLCVPARVSLWTGRWPHATRRAPQRDADAAGRGARLPALEARPGYHTALIGKDHCFAEADDRALFDVWCEIGHEGLPARRRRRAACPGCGPRPRSRPPTRCAARCRGRGRR
jgi:hypothetical protein